MKKFPLLFGLLLPVLCFAHKQSAHQYIVREAYTLLKNEIGALPQMDTHIGTQEGGYGGVDLSPKNRTES